MNMEQAYINIEETTNGNFSVNVKFHNSNIWLSKHQIANLFEVFISNVAAKLKVLFKNGLLDENKVKRNCQVKRKSSISEERGKAYMDYYNMEAILMLSFHLKSKKAEVFRKWIQTQLRKKMEEKEIPLIVASMGFHKYPERNN